MAFLIRVGTLLSLLDPYRKRLSTQGCSSDDLVEPLSLAGPFSNTDQSLINGEGDRIAFFENKKHAEVVCEILNIAATTGKLERMLSR